MSGIHPFPARGRHRGRHATRTDICEDVCAGEPLTPQQEGVVTGKSSSQGFLVS